VPPGVATVTFPDPAACGTVTVRLVLVAALTWARVRPNETLSSAAVAEKPVPVMVTVVPGSPIAGLIAVIVGTCVPARTEKVCALVAVVEPTVTATAPEFTPDGTVTTRRVADAEVTAAAAPLNVTVSADAVAENPVPLTVTLAPTAALLGSTALTVKDPAADRTTDNGFPLSSYAYRALAPSAVLTARSCPAPS
jgi:hypothetical protein